MGGDYANLLVQSPTTHRNVEGMLLQVAKTLPQKAKRHGAL
jgi:hypothetical protein